MTSVEGVDNDVPPKGYGVFGYSASNIGVIGSSIIGEGVRGISLDGFGITGNSSSSDGVVGLSFSGNGVTGGSVGHYGVVGRSYESFGVVGLSNNRIGVHGVSNGTSDTAFGVFGYSASNIGVYGGGSRSGVYGYSFNGDGVYGRSSNGYGVYGSSDIGYGVYGTSSSGLAAYLNGNVTITGTLQKGGGAFKIDHPLDPTNKYLSHSFVESPDMKNVYDGVVVLDDKGEAEIDLPDWFSALNKDFRYQLTAIGAPGPNLYIAEEISEATTTTANYTGRNNNNNNSSRFKVAGGTSGMKVSWQVTGIRKDPWANANQIQVEEDKPDKERGYYLHPNVYGQPEENGISHLLFPKEEEKWQEMRKRVQKV